MNEDGGDDYGDGAESISHDMQKDSVHIFIAVMVSMTMGAVAVSVGDRIQGFGGSRWYGGVE